jgi:hypothetical protein
MTSNLPISWKDLSPKSKILNPKYIFAICTYGIAPSQSLKHLEETINSFGGSPVPWICSGNAPKWDRIRKVTKVQQEMMFNKWKSRVDGVCDDVKNMKTEEIETSILFFNMFKTRTLKLLPVYLAFLKHVRVQR